MAFFVDYYKLNQMSMVDKFDGAPVFLKLDLPLGYHQ